MKVILIEDIDLSLEHSDNESIVRNFINYPQSTEESVRLYIVNHDKQVNSCTTNYGKQVNSCITNYGASCGQVSYSFMIGYVLGDVSCVG